MFVPKEEDDTDRLTTVVYDYVMYGDVDKYKVQAVLDRYSNGGLLRLIFRLCKTMNPLLRRYNGGEDHRYLSAVRMAVAEVKKRGLKDRSCDEYIKQKW